MFRLAVLIPVALLTAAAQECSELAYQSVDFFAAKSAAQWRQEILPAIRNQRAVVTVDPEAERYVTLLGNRLVDVLPAPQPSEFRFILYDDNMGLDAPWYGSLRVNPQIRVLPGDIVLVPLSLIDVTLTESELAAAIARGIAHAGLEHFTRFISKSTQVIMPIPPAGARPPVPPFTKTLLFPRSFEREADCAAIGVLAGAHFDPEALARYARNSLASFDTSDSRVQAIEAAVSKFPPRSYDPDDSPQFEQLKVRLKRR